MESVKILAEKAQLERLLGEEERTIWSRIRNIYNELKHLPFCNLMKGKHKFGVLQGWIKFKCLKDDMTWQDVKMRPIVSYKNHRWRKLFTLMSAF